jgi:hypothetical protein
MFLLQADADAYAGLLNWLITPRHSSSPDMPHYLSLVEPRRFNGAKCNLMLGRDPTSRSSVDSEVVKCSRCFILTCSNSNATNAQAMVHVNTLGHSIHLCGLRLLRSVLGSCCDPAANTSLQDISHIQPAHHTKTYQIQRPPNQMVFDTRAILRTSTSYHDN